MGILDFIGNLFKYAIILSLLTIMFLMFYHYFSGLAYLPENYYQTARSMYGDTGVHDLKNLTAVLNRTILPPYEEDVFDCSESSSYIEWYLEGHGFRAYIARSDALAHTWVIVELDDGSRVAVEATALTENNYNPPAIIDAPDGRYRNVSITWKEYLSRDSGESYEEYLEYYRYYYNPPKLFDNPGQMIGIASTLKYPGWVKLRYEEIDWWNSKPFSEIYPFSQWD